MGTPSGSCSKCGQPRRQGGRYCLACHAAWHRANRKPPAGESLERYRARKIAQSARRSGFLVPQPCADCGHAQTEMHHPDYTKPLEVIWLCRPHHLALHHAQPRS